MTCKIIAFTHPGKIRPNNEDALYAAGYMVQDREGPLALESEDTDILFLAADGMGGHEKGEVASRVVIEAVSQMLDPYRELNSDSIEEAILWACESLRRHTQTQSAASNMGSTLAGLWVRGDQGIVFNVGDSRVYLYENGQLERITKDHSLVWQRVEQGELTEEEARTYSGKNQLTSALTAWTDPLVEGWFAREIQVPENSIFLLCTDGLWETMSRGRLAECFQKAENIEDISRGLRSAALSTEAKDNLSFILAKMR